MGAYYDSKVEYLENSTGYEAIDTGIYGSNKTSIYLKVYLSDLNILGIDGGDRISFGANLYSSNAYGFTYNKSLNKFYYFYKTAASSNVSVTLNLNNTYKFEEKVESNRLKWYIDATLKASILSSDYTTAETLSIPAKTSSTEYRECHQFRLYRLKIYLEETLVRDMIPVRVGLTGYMYDKISGLLFGNVGSGSFVLGPDIYTKKIYSVDYLKNFRRRLMLSSAFDYDSYLTFKSITDCNFTFVSNLTDRGPIQYSIDNGSWLLASSVSAISNTTYTFPLVKAGSIILFKASFTVDSYYNKTDTYHYYFTSDGQFEAWGDPWSLYFPEDFKNQTFNVNQTFRGLFASCTGLISAEHMSLFTPTLLDYTYLGMFDSCSNLIKAPQIKATEVGAYSCYSMFYGCTSLTDVPDLKIMTFNGDNACRSMFGNCTSLQKAPTLPATLFPNSRQGYYLRMFNGCTSLNYIKSLHTNMDSSSYTNGNTYQWVQNVSSSGTFVKNINANWTVTGTSSAPSNWTILYFDPDTEKYYLSDKTTECDEYGNVI